VELASLLTSPAREQGPFFLLEGSNCFASRTQVLERETFSSRCETSARIGIYFKTPAFKFFIKPFPPVMQQASCRGPGERRVYMPGTSGADGGFHTTLGKGFPARRPPSKQAKSPALQPLSCFTGRSTRFPGAGLPRTFQGSRPRGRVFFPYLGAEPAVRCRELAAGAGAVAWRAARCGDCWKLPARRPRGLLRVALPDASAEIFRARCLLLQERRCPQQTRRG